LFIIASVRSKKTTSIAEPITSPVEADYGRDHHVGHDFLGGYRHWNVPDAPGERLSWTPKPENEWLAAFDDHRESASSAAVSVGPWRRHCKKWRLAGRGHRPELALAASSLAVGARRLRY
jgi:hypothetical protein